MIEDLITGFCSGCATDSVFKYAFIWEDMKKLSTYKPNMEYMYNCIKCGTTKTLHNIKECTDCKKKKSIDYQI